MKLVIGHCTCGTCNSCIIECNDGDVRLADYVEMEVNNTQSIAGPLEICVNRSWASICDDEFDNNMQAIQVACTKMGYTGT